MSTTENQPPGEAAPNKGTTAAIGFFITYFLLATASSMIGLVVEGNHLAELDRKRIEAGKPAIDAAARSGMLVGYILPNFVVPILVSGLFAIGKRFRNRRSFGKVAMITSIVILASALGTLGRMNQPSQQSREQKLQELKQLQDHRLRNSP